MTMVDILDGGPPPKRGDLVYTNIGNKRERTWMILRTKKVNRIVRDASCLVPRYNVWMARWWELEPDFRMRLYRSAERNGGQNAMNFQRYRPKPKKKAFLFA